MTVKHERTSALSPAPSDESTPPSKPTHKNQSTAKAKTKTKRELPSPSHDLKPADAELSPPSSSTATDEPDADGKPKLKRHKSNDDGARALLAAAVVRIGTAGALKEVNALVEETGYSASQIRDQLKRTAGRKNVYNALSAVAETL